MREPIIRWPVAAAREAGIGRVVVVDSPERRLRDALDENVVTVVQERPLGTADAVRAATAEFADAGTVLVLNGDAPLIDPRRCGRCSMPMSAAARRRRSRP